MLYKVALPILLTSILSFPAVEAFNFKPFASRASFTSANISNTVQFSFNFPNMELVDHRNQSVQLSNLFSTDNNVVFAFFFTHCVTVCTTVTLSLKSIQSHLPDNTKIVLISIDPDTDTPDILSKYAGDHKIVEPNWYLLTGNNQQLINLQKSFEAYRGNKMNHNTSLFIKKSNSEVITEIKQNFSSIPRLLSQNL